MYQVSGFCSVVLGKMIIDTRPIVPALKFTNLTVVHLSWFDECRAPWPQACKNCIVRCIFRSDLNILGITWGPGVKYSVLHRVMVPNCILYALKSIPKSFGTGSSFRTTMQTTCKVLWASIDCFDKLYCICFKINCKSNSMSWFFSRFKWQSFSTSFDRNWQIWCSCWL